MEDREVVHDPTEKEKIEIFGGEIIPPEQRIRFQTFHVVNREGKEIGQITVAIYKEEDSFSMACAFCNQKDQFNRDFGKFISYRRLMYSPIGRGSVVSFTRTPGVKVNTLIKHNCLVLAAHYPVRWMLREVESVDQLK